MSHVFSMELPSLTLYFITSFALKSYFTYFVEKMCRYYWFTLGAAIIGYSAFNNGAR